VESVSEKDVQIRHNDMKKRFKFDRVFDPRCSEDEIFNHSALPIVCSALDGISSIYFCYGQTGSGKTHTIGMLKEMNGGSKGVLPTALRFIFTHIESVK